MPDTLHSHFLDEENNFIIIGINNEEKTFKIYQKKPDDLFFRPINPTLPYFLYNTITNQYNCLLNNEGSLFLIDHNWASNLFERSGTSTARLLSNKNAQEITNNLQKALPILNFEIPQAIELEKGIEPSINEIIDAKKDRIQTSLPEEVKDCLINHLKYYIAALSNLPSEEDKRSALDGLLNLNQNGNLNQISSSVLSEYWLAYQFITYPDVSIAECQEFVIQMIFAITEYHTNQPREIHDRALSQRTVQEFLLKDFTPVLSDEIISERYQAQCIQIDNFLDYPSGTDKNFLKVQLWNMMVNRIHPQPQPQNNQIQEFTNKTNDILNYWEPIIYTDFMAYLWQLCDMVLRFITYLDIFALRFSATAQLISEFEKLSHEQQARVCEEFATQNFENHISSKVWGC